MELERNRTKNFDLDFAFSELAYEATDPDVLEMRTSVNRRERAQDDPWLSRTYWSADLFEVGRMADVARRG